MNHPRESNQCEEQLSSQQKFMNGFALLGFSVLLAFILMVIYLIGERLNIAPVLSVFFLEGLTEGENWLLFFSMFILALFGGVLVIWGLYRFHHQHNCIPEE